jgi:hypothetical protein
VVLTWVPDGPAFWLARDYFPEIAPLDWETFPSTDDLLSLFAANVGAAEIGTVHVPHDCTDGVPAAYWRRPEAYLDPAARSAISSFSRIGAKAGLTKLRADVETGRWAALNSDLLALDEADFGYRLIHCEIAA